MKEGNHRGGLIWAPIDVSPQAEALAKFRGLNLNQLYKWSINQCLTVSRFHHRIELFDDAPHMAQGNLDKPRKATMNQWTKREAEIEGDIGTTVGMYGTQDGIVGKTLTSFKASTLPKDNADAKRVRFYRDRVRQLHRLRMPRDNPPDFINETYSRRTDVPTN